MKKTIFILLSLIIFSCGKGHRGDCFKGTGIETTEKREFDDFHGIKTFDNLDIILVESSENIIEITGGNKILEGITTSIEDGILTLRNENVCNFVRSYEKPITVKIYANLNVIWHDSDGALTNKDSLKQDTLTLHLTGGNVDLTLKNTFFSTDMYQTGDITLNGDCKKLHISLTSFGNFNSENLESNFAIVSNSGEGDLHVKCNTSLNAVTRSVGNIYYYGNPTESELLENGDGRIIKK